MEYTLYHGLSDLTVALAIITGLVGLVRYRRLVPSLRGVALLAMFDALVELTVSIVTNIFHAPNLFIAPFVIVGEIGLAALAYRRALQSATFTRVLPWALGLFSAYALAESLLRLSASRHLAALAVYGLGNLFISLSSNYLLTHCSVQLQRIILLGVRNTFNIQLYLAYCLALCLRPPQAKSLSVQ